MSMLSINLGDFRTGAYVTIHTGVQSVKQVMVLGIQL